MAFKIESVDDASPAARAGVRPGEALVSVNGHPIGDVLDYRYYTSDRRLSVVLRDESGAERTVSVSNPDYRPLGLNFATYLMDEKRSCANHCVFCFIDQLPAGLRESLYFKDDDMRLSFLLGNYITLTNLSDADIEKILALRISPINISVHATDPKLRVRLCRNPRAGQCFDIMHRLAAGGITMNCQIVLCPGLNDGDALKRTLSDLLLLWPWVNSVSVVPVGLTDHRDGLYPLRPVTREDARAALAIIEAAAARHLAAHGSRVVFASDEFYLKAERPLPDPDDYEGFPQLENGVGMLPLFCEEFGDALDAMDELPPPPPRFSLATGESAAPFLQRLADRLAERLPGFSCRVYTVKNRFFGGGVTVAGLLTGSDLLGALKGEDLGARLLIPASTLRYDSDLFLDDMTLPQLSAALSTPITPVPNDGAALLDAMLGLA
ncbi:MAG: DUF512 domain-containing protein [Oscillospiraceae bacterium]|jgi:putative radical SAM enzyme (TIGR03279 family)|nr:DUF512 domain-containing protein [Oscillospiraceae bacterium]